MVCQHSPTCKRLLLLLELALVGGLFLIMHLHLDIPGSQIPDYGWPDALFYSFGGENLAAGDGYHIKINDQFLPPKFPPGLPLLLAPWYALTGDGREGGLVVIQALAHLLALGTWFAARRQAGPVGGIGALLGLGASLSFAVFRNNFATLVPDALVLLGIYLLLSPTRPRNWRFTGAGLMVALGTWIHYPLVVTALPLVFFLQPRQPGWTTRLRAFAYGLVPPLLALLIWQWMVFGGPLSTGYGLWLPAFHEGSKELFSLDYALQGPLAGSMSGSNVSYYLHLLLGRGGAFYPWPVAGAIIMGLPFFWRRRTGALILSLGAALFLLFSVYFYQGERLLAALVPLLLVLGAIAVGRLGETLSNRINRQKKLVRILPALVLLGANLVSFHNHVKRINPAAYWLNGMTTYAAQLRRETPPGAIILTDRDILFLAGTLKDRTILPLKMHQDWTRILAFHDWRRDIRPKGNYDDFLQWAATRKDQADSIDNLGAFTAPPATLSRAYLIRELKCGRPLFWSTYDKPVANSLFHSFSTRTISGQTPPFLWQLLEFRGGK